MSAAKATLEGSLVVLGLDSPNYVLIEWERTLSASILLTSRPYSKYFILEDNTFEIICMLLMLGFSSLRHASKVFS